LGNYATSAQMGNAAQEARLNALTAGLQNASIPLQLAISQQAAENAGQSQSSGGK
jgi:hypothetical protein